MVTALTRHLLQNVHSIRCSYAVTFAQTDGSPQCDVHCCITEIYTTTHKGSTYVGVGGLEVTELVAGLVGPGARVVGRVLGRVGQVGGGVGPGSVLAGLSVGGSVLRLQGHEVGVVVSALLHGSADVGDIHHAGVLIVILDGALDVAHQVRQQHLEVVLGRHRAAGVEVRGQLSEVASRGVGGHGLGGRLECVEAGLAGEVDDGLTHDVHVLGEVGLSSHRGGGCNAAVSDRRVLQSKPGSQVAGVGAADGDHLAAVGVQVGLDVSDDAGEVGQSLVGRQVLQVGSTHIGRGVRLSVEAVLDVHQQGLVLLGQLVGVHAVRQAGATLSSLTADVHENGEAHAAPVLSVEPVPLTIASPFLLVHNGSKVVDHGVLEPILVNLGTGGGCLERCLRLKFLESLHSEADGSARVRGQTGTHNGGKNDQFRERHSCKIN